MLRLLRLLRLLHCHGLSGLASLTRCAPIRHELVLLHRPLEGGIVQRDLRPRAVEPAVREVRAALRGHVRDGGRRLQWAAEEDLVQGLDARVLAILAEKGLRGFIFGCSQVGEQGG